MAKNTDNRNRSTRVKVRPANAAAERPARRQPPKKQGGGAATVLLILLVVLMFAALAGWLVKVALGNDRKEIKPQTSAVSSEESLAPAESVDVDALTQNFTYVTVNSKQMNDGLLDFTVKILAIPHRSSRAFTAVFLTARVCRSHRRRTRNEGGQARSSR